MKYYIPGILVAVVGISEVGLRVYRMIKRRREDRLHDQLTEVLMVNNHWSMKCNHNDTTTTSTNEGVAECWNSFCSVKIENRIVQLINSATKSINCCMYLFTILELANALNEAKRRGVIVRVITDAEMAFSSGSRITTFVEEGNFFFINFSPV